MLEVAFVVRIVKRRCCTTAVFNSTSELNELQLREGGITLYENSSSAALRRPFEARSRQQRSGEVEHGAPLLAVFCLGIKDTEDSTQLRDRRLTEVHKGYEASPTPDDDPFCSKSIFYAGWGCGVLRGMNYPCGTL